eukprot:g14360.t1
MLDATNSLLNESAAEDVHEALDYFFWEEYDRALSVALDLPDSEVQEEAETRAQVFEHMSFEDEEDPAILVDAVAATRNRAFVNEYTRQNFFNDEDAAKMRCNAYGIRCHGVQRDLDRVFTSGLTGYSEDSVRADPGGWT